MLAVMLQTAFLFSIRNIHISYDRKDVKKMVIYIVMHSKRVWKKGESSLNGHFLVSPVAIAVYDSYEAAQSYIEKYQDYKPSIGDWKTETYNLPASDEECFGRMWIIEKIVRTKDL